MKIHRLIKIVSKLKLVKALLDITPTHARMTGNRRFRVLHDAVGAHVITCQRATISNDAILLQPDVQNCQGKNATTYGSNGPQSSRRDSPYGSAGLAASSFCWMQRDRGVTLRENACSVGVPRMEHALGNWSIWGGFLNAVSRPRDPGSRFGQADDGCVLYNKKARICCSNMARIRTRHPASSEQVS